MDKSMPKPMPASPNAMDPRMSLTWDKEKPPTMVGDGMGDLRVDETVRITVEGKVKGYAMHEYGCSIDVSAKKIKIEALESTEDTTNGGPVTMVASMKKLRPGKGSAYA